MINKSLENLRSQRFSDRGVLILSLDYLFKLINSDREKTYVLRASYFEIYNEQVFDLLRSNFQIEEPLLINEDTQKKDFYVKGLQEEPINSLEDALYYLQLGEENRHYAETVLNHASSRSHTIFKVYVLSISNNYIKDRLQSRQYEQNVNQEDLISVAMDNYYDEDGTTVIEGQMNFVDLAGSEKISNHHSLIEELAFRKEEIAEELLQNDYRTIRERIKESQAINKSLFFLTQVISLKSQDRTGSHIPYRNSVLTKLLK